MELVDITHRLEREVKKEGVTKQAGRMVTLGSHNIAKKDLPI
jgi:hypothetical protein